MNNELDEASIPLRIGVSSCLLGKEVRFDAGHKRDRYLTDILDEQPAGLIAQRAEDSHVGD